MSFIGVAGTKTFWKGKDHYWLTGTYSCPGCGLHLAAKLILRTIYETAPETLVFGRSCGGGRSELQTGGRIAQDGSGLLGIEIGMRLRGIGDRRLVCLTADGRMLDMGFGDLVPAFDRLQMVTWIILDNQSYTSAGGHVSPTSPWKSTSRIFTAASGGRPWPERDVALMMIHTRARYVATATPAYVTDLVAKVQRGLYHQPSFIQVVAPCQNAWRYDPNEVIQVSRLLVQTGQLPLWEYKDGVLKRTVRIPPSARAPLADWFRLQGRFRHVTDEDIKEAERHVEHINTVIDRLEGTFSTEC